MLPFNVLSPTSALIVTSRSQNMATAVNLVTYTLPLPDIDLARAILARNTSIPIEDLPPEAHAVVEHCGRLPLALAMIGAMIRNTPSMSWGRVLESLHVLTANDEGGPGGSTSKVMASIGLSIKALTALRFRYLDLAVFPEGVLISPHSLLMMWSVLPEPLDADDVDRMVDMFVEKSLLQRNAIGLLRIHDLQRSYAISVAERRPAGLARLHARLLAGYAALIARGGGGGGGGGSGSSGGSGASADNHPGVIGDPSSADPVETGEGALDDVAWDRGPHDGYFFEHLVWHLLGAGRREAARDLMFNFAWIQAKVMALGAMDGVASDYLLVAGALPSKRDGETVKALKVMRSALLLSALAVHADASLLAFQLLGRLCHSTDPRIRRLLAQALASLPPSAAAGLFIPSTPVLESPGGWLVRILQGHKGGVEHVFCTGDGKFLVSTDPAAAMVWDAQTGMHIRTLAFGTGSGSGGSVTSSSPRSRLGSPGVDDGGGFGSVPPTTSGDHGNADAPSTSAAATTAAAAAASAAAAAAVAADDDNDLAPNVRRAIAASSLDRLMMSRRGGSGSSGRVVNRSIRVGRERTEDVFLKGATSEARAQKWRRSVFASSDGFTLSVADPTAGAVRFWDLRTGLAHDTAEVDRVLGLSPDGRYAVCSAADQGGGGFDLLAINLTTLQPTARFESHTRQVCAVAFTADGERVATGGLDRAIHVWEVQGGALCATLSHHDVVTDILPMASRGGDASGDAFVFADSVALHLWEPGSDFI